MTAPADLAALAATARGYAGQHPPGSLGRRAWGCAAVALATTRSLAAARKALDGVRLDDVRAAALRALDALAGQDSAPAPQPEP